MCIDLYIHTIRYRPTLINIGLLHKAVHGTRCKKICSLSHTPNSPHTTAHIWHQTCYVNTMCVSKCIVNNNIWHTTDATRFCEKKLTDVIYLQAQPKLIMTFCLQSDDRIRRSKCLYEKLTVRHCPDSFFLTNVNHVICDQKTMWLSKLTMIS